MDFLKRVLGRLCRSPDVIIGGHDNPYMLRWHIIPRNRVFNIYLHKFLRDDDDRALHDHPWISCSVILKGKYKEYFPECNCSYLCRSSGPLMVKERHAGRIAFRRAGAAHRIELYGDSEKRDVCWSLFITGPKVREWGFLCPKGWRHWREFCNPMNSGEVGRGCE